MTYGEYLTWCLYREKYGPLNPVRMFDRGPAVVAQQINGSNGGKAKVSDFMPFGHEVKREVEITDYIQAAFGGKVKIGKRR